MTYGERKLPYPYSYVLQLVFPANCGTETDGTALDSGGNLYVVSLTPEQALKFTSALQAGYDLLYPDEWQVLMQSWLNARALVNTLGWYDESECEIVTVCDAVASCITNSEGVQDALDGWLQGDDTETVVQNIIQQVIGQNGYMPSSVQANTDDSLDCVYGALTDAYDLVLDAWLAVKTAVDGAVSVIEAITDLTKLIPLPSKQVMEGLDIAITVGSSAYDAWINSQTVTDQFVCGVFDEICARGEPYTMELADIVAGFNAMTNAPVPQLTDTVRFALQPLAFQNYWAIRTDDTCSNDWQTKCDCTPIEWCHEFDFTVSDGGWEPVDSNGERARYIAGVGWTNGTAQPSFEDEVRITRTIPATVTLRTVEITFSTIYNIDGGTVRVDGVTVASGLSGSSPILVEFDQDGDDMRVDLTIGTLQDQGLVITAIEVCGEGTDPF